MTLFDKLFELKKNHNFVIITSKSLKSLYIEDYATAPYDWFIDEYREGIYTILGRQIISSKKRHNKCIGTFYRIVIE